jgi:hypothetical protein
MVISLYYFETSLLFYRVIREIEVTYPVFHLPIDVNLVILLFQVHLQTADDIRGKTDVQVIQPIVQILHFVENDLVLSAGNQTELCGFLQTLGFEIV